MINAFRLTRFRAFEDTHWIQLRPLTLFLGRNSSGKSTLLAGLLMLRQSILNPDPETPFVFASDQGVDLGSYEDLIFGQRYHPERPIGVSLQVRFPRPSAQLLGSDPLSEAEINLQIGYEKPYISMSLKVLARPPRLAGRTWKPT